jgi:hypothetical protein
MDDPLKLFLISIPDELILRLDNGLEEPEVLHVPAVGLDTVDEVLDDLLVHLVAQRLVALEDAAHRLCLQQLKNEP